MANSAFRNIRSIRILVIVLTMLGALLLFVSFSVSYDLQTFKAAALSVQGRVIGQSDQNPAGQGAAPKWGTRMAFPIIEFQYQGVSYRHTSRVDKNVPMGEEIRVWFSPNAPKASARIDEELTPGAGGSAGPISLSIGGIILLLLAFSAYRFL